MTSRGEMAKRAGGGVDYGLADKFAVVCASSRGLGYACAHQLAHAGCGVAINGRDGESLALAAKAIEAETGRPVIAIAGDIAEPSVQQALLSAVPRVDILVNNNGGPAHRSFQDLDREAIIEGVHANMITPFELVRQTVDGMVARGFGRIINITSIAVVMPLPGLDLSSGARAGLTALLAGLARSVAHANVTINFLLPGAFATARIHENLEAAARRSGGPADEVLRQREQSIPARRFGLPEELAAACCFLSSEQAGYITGQSIRIDGGSYPGMW